MLQDVVRRAKAAGLKMGSRGRRPLCGVGFVLACCGGNVSPDMGSGAAGRAGERIESDLHIEMKLSAPMLGAGEKLTVDVTATNGGTNDALHGVDILLPVATENLDLVSSDSGGTSSGPVSTFDDRIDVFHWHLDELKPGASAHHQVVLRESKGIEAIAYNGVVAFSRDEAGPMADNGIFDQTRVRGLVQGQAVPSADVMVSQEAPPLALGDGVYELKLAVSNLSETHEAKNVRVIGCLDPTTDFAISSGVLTPVGEEKRCYQVGFPSVSPANEAHIRYRFRVREDIGQVPERFFTSVFVTAQGADPDLRNNWILLVTAKE